jgi:ATP adenylyltransferase
MRMSHVDQLLMLMEFVGGHSPAPAQDVARRILGEDVTQIDYYTERVKRMVGKVLTGNGITRYDQGAYDLVGGEELSDAERDELLQLCRQRLDAFREQRGEEVGCLLTQKPAASGTGAPAAPRSAARLTSGCSPGPMAAPNAAGRAVARQIPHQRALEVDPIVPMNRGGTGDSAICRHSASLMPIQVRCFQRRGSWRPCRAITRISVPCSRK